MNFLGTILPFLRAEGVAVEATYGRGKRPAGGPEIDPGASPGPVLSLRVSSERGGPLVAVIQKHSEAGYVVYVGEREFVARQPSDDPARTWTGATVATLDILNVLLDAHDSVERAWALMGGNDLDVVFASEAARGFINSTLAPRDHLHDGTKG